MRISKIDTIKIAIKKIKRENENPLAAFTCEISLIFCAPDAPMEMGLVSL
jgi:hypothetical protein